MALPLVRQQDALQIGMPFEHEAEHVVALAFEPICRGPKLTDARHRFAVSRMSLQAQPLVLRKRIEVEDYIEPLFALGPVDRRQIGQHVELFLIAAVLRDFPKPRKIDPHDGLLAIERSFANRITEAHFQALHEFVVEWNWRWNRRCGGL